MEGTPLELTSSVSLRKLGRNFSTSISNCFDFLATKWKNGPKLAKNQCLPCLARLHCTTNNMYYLIYLWQIHYSARNSGSIVIDTLLLRASISKDSRASHPWIFEKKEIVSSLPTNKSLISWFCDCIVWHFKSWRNIWESCSLNQPYVIHVILVEIQHLLIYFKSKSWKILGTIITTVYNLECNAYDTSKIITL